VRPWAPASIPSARGYTSIGGSRDSRDLRADRLDPRAVPRDEPGRGRVARRSVERVRGDSSARDRADSHPDGPCYASLWGDGDAAAVDGGSPRGTRLVRADDARGACHARRGDAMLRKPIDRRDLAGGCRSARWQRTVASGPHHGGLPCARVRKASQRCPHEYVRHHAAERKLARRRRSSRRRAGCSAPKPP
jgi:hypothetical protein